MSSSRNFYWCFIEWTLLKVPKNFVEKAYYPDATPLKISIRTHSIPAWPLLPKYKKYLKHLILTLSPCRTMLWKFYIHFTESYSSAERMLRHCCAESAKINLYVFLELAFNSQLISLNKFSLVFYQFANTYQAWWKCKFCFFFKLWSSTEYSKMSNDFV